MTKPWEEFQEEMPTYQESPWEQSRREEAEIQAEAANQPDYWRMAAQGVGSIPGALVGSALGPAGTAGGGALTGAIAGQVYDLGKAFLQGEQLPSGQEQAMRAVEDVAYDVGTGALLGPVVKGATKLIDPVSDRLAQAWARAGQQPPSLAAVSESPAVQRAESFLGGTLTGGGRISKAYEAGREALQEASEEVAAKTAKRVPQTVTEIGESALESAATAKKEFQEWAKANEEALFQPVAAEPAGLNNTLKWMEEEAGKLSPNKAESFRQSVRDVINEELQDAMDGTLNIQTLRDLKTDIGRKLTGETAVTTNTVLSRKQSMLRNAIDKDLKEAITDPRLRAQFDTYSKEYGRRKAIKDLAEPLLATKKGAKDAEAIGEMIISPNMTKQKALILKEALGEEAFNELRAGAIQQLGRTAGGKGLPVGQASPANVAKMLGTSKGSVSPEAQQIVYGQDAQNLATMAGGMQDANKFYNWSESGNVENLARTLRGLPGLVQAATTGGGLATGEPAVAGASLVMPYLGSVAHTSPTVIRALSSPGYKESLFAARKFAPTLAAGMWSGPVKRTSDKLLKDSGLVDFSEKLINPSIEALTEDKQFLKWLDQTDKAVEKSPANLSIQMNKLGLLIKRNPEKSEDYIRYAKDAGYNVRTVKDKNGKTKSIEVQ